MTTKRQLAGTKKVPGTKPPLRLGFGKYCGNTLAEVLEKDRRYCTWFAENCFDGAPEAARKLILHAWGMA